MIPAPRLVSLTFYLLHRYALYWPLFCLWRQKTWKTEDVIKKIRQSNQEVEHLALPTITKNDLTPEKDYSLSPTKRKHGLEKKIRNPANAFHESWIWQFATKYLQYTKRNREQKLLGTCQHHTCLGQDNKNLHTNQHLLFWLWTPCLQISRNRVRTTSILLCTIYLKIKAVTSQTCFNCLHEHPTPPHTTIFNYPYITWSQHEQHRSAYYNKKSIDSAIKKIGS